MDMSHAFWDDAPNMRHVKYESCSSSNDGLHQMSSRHGGNSTSNTSTTMLNFSTNDDESAIEYAAAAAFRRHSGTSLGSSQNSSQHLHQTQQQRVSRQDPLSHRIIEKRRRDRMNNCLADLSKLIPAEYLKKGRGRVEKTEIIEMAIKHMKHLQNMNHHRLGYQECMSEVMRFMVEVEGHFPREPLCVRLLSHLQQHCDSISMHGSIDLPIVYPSSTGLSNTSSPPPEPKVEPNNNNNNNNNNGTTNNNNSSETYESNAEEDQHLEEKHNTETYKYKNDIKLRFTQDLTCSDTVGSKRQKMVISGATGRRNSGASTENQSSGNSSPPRSDHCPRLLPSDGETVNTLRTSPSDSSISISAHNHHARNTHYHHGNRHSHHTNSISKLSLTNNHKSVSNLVARDDNSPLTNYTVPIFALHTKGAFYIPLTVDYGALLPYLPDGCDLATLDHHSSLILHPVAINVNFLPRKSGY